MEIAARNAPVYEDTFNALFKFNTDQPIRDRILGLAGGIINQLHTPAIKEDKKGSSWKPPLPPRDHVKKDEEPQTGDGRHKSTKLRMNKKHSTDDDSLV